MQLDQQAWSLYGQLVVKVAFPTIADPGGVNIVVVSLCRFGAAVIEALEWPVPVGTSFPVASAVMIGVSKAVPLELREENSPSSASPVAGLERLVRLLRRVDDRSGVSWLSVTVVAAVELCSRLEVTFPYQVLCAAVVELLLEAVEPRPCKMNEPNPPVVDASAEGSSTGRKTNPRQAGKDRMCILMLRRKQTNLERPCRKGDHLPPTSRTLR